MAWWNPVSWVKKGWKSVKKAFGSVGKFIKKGLRKLGKFVNSLGIVGQIGMAMAMPAISRAMIGGLSALGSGWMTGLSEAAKAGSGIAKVGHALLQGSLDGASAVASGFGTITEAVGGVVGGTANAIGSTFGFDTPVEVYPGSKEMDGSFGQVLSNVAKILDEGGEEVGGHLKSIGGKFVDLGKDILPRGEGKFFGEGEYAPTQREFTLPSGEVVNREIAYNPLNQELYKNSPEGAMAREAYLKTPEARKAYLDTPEGDRKVRELRAATPGSDMDILFDKDYDEKTGVSDEMIESAATQQSDIPVPKDWIESYVPETAVPSKEPSKSLLGGTWENMKAGAQTSWENPFTKEALATTAAKTLAQLALEKMSPEEERQAVRSGAPATPNFNEIYALTASVGSGVEVPEFGAGVNISPHPDSVAARNMLGGAENLYSFQEFAESSNLPGFSPSNTFNLS